MAVYKIQGNSERQRGIFYEFDSEEEPLGVGGMGKVYRGRCVDERMGSTRQVAIKFMYDDLPPQVIERARREASIQIRHENLVEMLGFIETEETNVLGEVRKHYHVVSELLEGVMLDDLLQGRRQDRYGQPLPFAEKLYNDYQRDPYHFAVFIIRNILSGLTTLHDVGYIHRDIDPTNIMVTADGRVKLIDFGIAKQMRLLTSHDKSLTVSGAFMGKPEYAAPELVLGDIKSQSQATDIYAVGVLMFQCIVGHPPFEGERQEVLQMQLHKAPPLYLIRNSRVRSIVRTAMEKSRHKRFRSASEFRVALDNLPLQLKDDAIIWKKSYSIAAVAVALCAGMGVGVAALWPAPPSPEPVPQSQEASIPVSSPQPESLPSAPSLPSVDYREQYEKATAIYMDKTKDRQENIRAALPLYREALEAAMAAEDAEYVEKITEKIQRLEERLKK
ncbi:MAG: serine/threonine protein kinase [Bacteroidaceae bacterium]|nr:serine/threonine protein kinase [Bacteroidaceae bacterium]